MLATALISSARQRSGLSIRELAQRAGTSHATLLAYEAGRKVPSVVTLERIVQAAGFALDFTLERRIRGEVDYDRGQELADALELAACFPSRHSEQMNYPTFAKVNAGD